jgi:hypothetical protein
MSGFGANSAKYANGVTRSSIISAITKKVTIGADSFLALTAIGAFG